MRTPKLTDSQIMAILKQQKGGTPVPALCREHNISSATFYKWRARFGGMDVSLMARLKELEDENRRLKMYAEEKLKAEIVQEASQKSGEAISAQRDGPACGDGKPCQHSRGVSGVPYRESCYRYEAKLSDENAEIADWLIRLTNNQKNWGFADCVKTSSLHR